MTTNLTTALKTLRNNGATHVTHSQGETWDIDNLIIESQDDISDWAVDADRIERLDKNGCRTGEYYTAIES